MAGHRGLYLHEEILLLALKDEKGTFASGTQYSFGMGGAILAELLLDKRIRVVTPRKTALAELAGGRRYGEPVLDECLDKVATAKKRAALQTWVSRFAHVKRLRHRVAEGLAQRGILRVDSDKILGIFNRTIYPERDPEPERRIIGRLRRAIFEGTKEIDPRTVTLVSLAHHTGILKVVFDKKKLNAHKARIETIMNGDLTAKATAEAIEAMQAAVLVACILPAVFISTTATR
jgi:hypothetical protein